MAHKKPPRDESIGHWKRNRITLHDPMKVKVLARTMSKHSKVAFSNAEWHQAPYLLYYVFRPNGDCTIVYYSYDLD